MPMHYPPLADGTYRYGDPPRPLPSPVPGPDPGAAHPHAADHPHAAAPEPHPGHQPPPPDGPPGHGPATQEPSGQRRSGGTAAAAIIGVAALVVVVVLGLALFGPGSDSGRGSDTPFRDFPSAAPAPGGADSPGAAEFTVEGRFTVVSTPDEPVSGDGTGCDLPLTLSDIGEGTAISLSLGPAAVLDTTMLAYDGGDLSSCTFTFEFADVPAGAGVYLIELPGRGQLNYTEQELRAGVDITLGR